MTDSEFLTWVADRLVHVHGDPEHIDFVLKLRRMAAVLPQEAGAPPMAAEEPYAQAIKFRRERDAAEAAYLYRIKELAGLRGEVSRLQEALRELTARYGRPATESGGPFL